MILRKQCPIFPFLPSLPRHFLLLWLHNHSRLYYKLLSNEKETSACSGIHFLTMGPFVLIESGNGKERERKRETDREGGGEALFQGSPSDCVAPWASKWGLEKGKEGWSVKEGGQRQKPPRRIEGKLRESFEELNLYHKEKNTHIQYTICMMCVC